MPKISKNKLDQKTYDNVLKRLTATLTLLRTDQEVLELIDSLFTRTERLMLAKRLAIAVFLERGMSYAEISKLLKVSSVTISFVRNNIMKERPAYSALIKAIKI